MDLQQSIQFLAASNDFLELKPGPHLSVDLRYGTDNNFVGLNMYGAFNKAYLHRQAALMFQKAQALLQQQRPGFGFVVFDALRPRSVQRILWQHVVNTPNQQYIANPDMGSLHNFGFAIDLSITDGTGQAIDMGAGYDDFRPIAQPQLESEFLRSGELSEAQLQNRLLLRGIMQSAGFIQLPHEWWHFDALTKAEVRAKFKIVE